MNKNNRASNVTIIKNIIIFRYLIRFLSKKICKLLT